jgi:general stress protein 26
MAEARKLVWDNLKDCQIIFLATVDGKCPRVRPVTLMRKGNNLFTVSMLKNAKVNQIRKNSKVEFAFSIPDMGFNAIRVECTADVVEDRKVKSEIYDSPEHALIKLSPTKFTILMPPEFENITVSPT